MNRGLSTDPDLRARQLSNLARGRGADRWRGKLTTPDLAHPLVREFIAQANEQLTTMSEIAARAGLPRATLSSWRTKCVPKLDNFVAALNVLDLELVIRPRRHDDPDAPRRPRGRPRRQQDSVPVASA